MGLFDKIFGDKNAFERKSSDERNSVDRVVGGTRRNRKEARAMLEKRFKEQDSREYAGLERPKTPEDLQMIALVNRETDRLREKYGLPEYFIPPENIHILDGERTKGNWKFVQGAFGLYDQNMYVTDTGSKLHLLGTLFHEAIHFKSFGSVNVFEHLDRPRRVGLAVEVDSYDGEKAFRPLNEAVTEELAKRLTRASHGDATVAAEAAVARRVSEGLSPEEQEEIAWCDVVPKEGGPTEVKHFGFHYPKERQALKLLISKLQERSPDAGRDAEAWFDMFAGAMFNGHLLELARAVEKTFGQGKFRELGEQKTGADFLKFVESL